MINSSKLLRDYLQTISESNPDIGWDDIIITARDDAQKSAYVAQLEQHFKSLITKFHVFADPIVLNDGQPIKIGSGGCTIAVLQWLRERYGNTVFAERKVLLIHCGGYSQRTTQYTALGKIFASLPIDVHRSNEHYNWTMLDLKLALLKPFSVKMSSGVWVSAPDDIVIYEVDDEEFERIPKFQDESFVALGHPSPVSIAVNHGVYVLEKTDNLTKTASINSCLRVLQKPSTSELKENNAIIDNDLAITDSSYYIGRRPLELLCSFDISTLTSEVDCYGHFQCPLGSSPSPSQKYTSPIATLLSGTPLKVLYLSNSIFYHLGTMPEYFEHLTNYKTKHLALALEFVQNSKTGGTAINSILDDRSILDENTIIENSKLEIPISTNNNVIYGCFASRAEISNFPNITSLNFPESYLVFTVAINHSDKSINEWITVSVPLKSDMKSELWTKKLFSCCQTPTNALVVALGLASPTTDEKWSLRDIMMRCDPRKMIQLHSLSKV